MLEILQTYVAWIAAGALAGSYYTMVGRADDHLAPQKKENVILWLMGAYRGSWARSFCEVFDWLFGSRHASFRCFATSVLFSITTTVALYGLLGSADEGMSLRLGLSDEVLTVADMVVLALLVNAIPDYLSLYETRWLLGKFRDTDSSIRKLLLLVVDVVFTAVLIFMFINLYTWVRHGYFVHLSELVAGLSIYSVLFYSTFMTSVWAWIYAISSLIMRVASRSWLKDWLDVENAPFKQIGLIGFPIVFLSTLGLSSITGDMSAPDSRIDAALCTVFPAAACDDAARLSSTDEKRLDYMKRHCIEGRMTTCLDTAIEYLKIDASEAIELLGGACNLNDGEGCGLLASLHEKANESEVSSRFTFGAFDLFPTESGVKDPPILQLWDKACRLGEAHACAEFAQRLKDGESTKKDLARSRTAARRSCDLNHSHGCRVLAVALLQGQDAKSNELEAQTLMERVCHKDEDASGCLALHALRSEGKLPEVSDRSLTVAHEKACELNTKDSCEIAAVEYMLGRYVTMDLRRAEALLERGCTMDSMKSCALLGEALAIGYKFRKDVNRAVPYLEKACSSGIGRACSNLGLVQSELGTESEPMARALFQRGCDLDDASACANFARSLRRAEHGTSGSSFLVPYGKACSLGDAGSCTALADLYRQGVGVTASMPKAIELFESGCVLDSGYGCAQAGALTLFSEGRSDDDELLAKGLRSLQKACMLKHPGGCRVLSTAYATGAASPVDTTRALDAAVTGCDLGDGEACHYAGSLLLNRNSDDRRAARASFEKSCNAGFNKGCLAVVELDEAEG